MNSGIAPFFTKSLQMNRRSASVYTDVSKDKDKSHGNGEFFSSLDFVTFLAGPCEDCVFDDSSD